MEQKSLMNELMQGKDLAKQLITHLQPCSSNETRLFLIQKTLSSYEKSLSILNWGAFVDDNKTHFDSINIPGKDGYRGDRKRKNEEIYENRKIQPKWTEQVKDCSGTGLEEPLDDGYSWRKYGQKVILGANFPRSYYRCTHLHVSGCLAKKQVQRSDEDQTIFEITYKGRHTCTQLSQSLTQSNSVKKEVQDQTRKLQNIPNKLDEMRIDFDTNVKVKIEGLETEKDEISPSIWFSNGSGNFSSDLLIENNFLVSLSPPSTSESNYFSPFQIDNFGALPQNVHAPESYLTEIISITSPFEDFEFDTNFPGEAPKLFDSSSKKKMPQQHQLCTRKTQTFGDNITMSEE